MISIIIITYNHEQFIQQAIEGILSQKVNTTIEIIIGEDFSTDKTREICENYKKKYPSLINLLPSNKNLGMTDNFIRSYNACRGKYIAICEGDDYWIEPYKLQKQLDILEKHKDCTAVFHNSAIVENNTIIGSVYKESILNITIKDLFRGKYMKTNTIMFRNKGIISPEIVIDDTTLGLFLLDDGSYAHYIDETMSAYRIHEGGIESKVSAKKSFYLNLKTNILVEKIYYKKYPDWVNDSSLVFFTDFSIRLLSQKYIGLALKCFIRSFKYRSTLKSRSTYLYTFFKQILKIIIKLKP